MPKKSVTEAFLRFPPPPSILTDRRTDNSALEKLRCLSVFDFIECFTTTFLRAHSWLNWVDEDDDEDAVGLKEKPEDTRYIKKITLK